MVWYVTKMPMEGLATFNCGQPPRYNFTQELEQTLSVSESVKIHFFIFDDGATALAEAAIPSKNPLWSQPSASITRAITNPVIPSLRG